MANNKIQAAAQRQAPEEKAKQSINTMLNSLLDGEKMRARFEELLGDRTAQFLSSLVTMINDDPNMQQAFYDSPMSVIKSALRAAMYDLPIDPALGYSFILPFRNRVKKPDGSYTYRMEATYVPGYKGLKVLCHRTGAYARVPNATDVREGELVSYNRLTGDAEFNWIDNEDERDDKPIIGYAGYFRLLNGSDFYLYMTKKQIDDHEQRNRKGQNMTKGWRENYDDMAKKTVIRQLCTKHAIMSIDYRINANQDTVNLAMALAQQDYPDIIDDDIPLVEDEPEAEAPMLPEAQGQAIDWGAMNADFLKEGAEYEPVHA